MNPRDLFRLQEEQNLRATLRSGKTGTRLLDDAENNIGNAIVLEPQILPVGQVFTTIPQSGANNARLLNLTSTSKTGQSVTVVVTAAKMPNQSGSTGPYTGIAEFGNGVVTTRVEFDVPFGPFQNKNLYGSDPSDQPQDSGAIIQLPTGILRLFARYDNAFITPQVEGYAFGDPPPPRIPLPVGSGPLAPNSAPVPLATKAFATYFGRIHTKLYKTQYVFRGILANPVSFFYPTIGSPDPVLYCVPPFAKSVRVVRLPQTAAMTLQLLDTSVNSTFGETFNIPSGISPVIPIEGNETVISLASATGGGADKVYLVKLVYEIAF